MTEPSGAVALVDPGSRRPAAATGTREPLNPGPPRPLLSWVRGSSGTRRFTTPTWLWVPLVVLTTLALGTWGFLELRLLHRLDFLESLYAAVKLYTLDLGPAGGASPGANWQIWLALVAAAGLVLRGVVGLGRERARRWSAGHLLSGHVVICGAGVHGTQLAKLLSPSHDVVLIDLDPVSPGMQEPRGHYEWRLTGDAVSARTLRAAGIARAAWVIAVTGDDFVNSQIVSGIRSLARTGDAPDRLHVLVQVEDPALTRFLEEDEALEAAAGAWPIVSPFSANAIAAEVLLDESRVRGREDADLPMMGMRDGAAPNLLLVGDHPLLDAIVLAVLRRWRVRVLRELESGSGRLRPPVHVSIFGPGAERRAVELREAWHPEPDVMVLEGRDSPPAGEIRHQIDDWLRRPGRADHAIVACLDELHGIGLTLEVARELGNGARMTRVTTQFENELDAYVEQRTSNSRALATTEVKSIAELGARPEQIRTASARRRLVEALSRHRDRRPPPGEARRGARDPDPVARTRAVFESPVFTVRSDITWRVRAADRRLLDALLDVSPELVPIPLSAVLRAGLRLDLDSAEALLAAALLLTERREPAALTAWCEYLRSPAANPADPAIAAAAASSPDPAVRALLGVATRQNAGRAPEPALAGARHVTIFAGAAGSMSAVAADALETLLDRALIRHDGVLLSGGTEVGMPGLIGRLARRHRLPIIGYVPSGFGDRSLYPELRETPEAGDFSVLEPLAMWQDIVSSGFDPRKVALIVCPGGEITLQEIALARAMGARVAWIDPTGDATRPLEELLTLGAGGVVELPADPMTVRAFMSPTVLSDPPREAIAHYVHNDYRRRERGRKRYGDPAMARWEELPETLRASNLAFADDIPGKLALIGRQAVPGGGALELTDEQVELLAEVEHGRWNAERLSAGWRVGPRQVGHSTSPDLIPWAELPPATRDYDREAVRTIGPALAEAGWGVSDV